MATSHERVIMGYMVLASRASGCLFGHPNPQKEPLRTPNFLCGISKNLNLKFIIEFFHLLIIPVTFFNDIMTFLMNLYMFMVEI